jgi:hypothetical protein
MSSFEANFPHRVFLDSSVLQTMQTYGEFLYDGGEIEAEDRIHRDPHGLEKLVDLRSIVQVGYRAPFEFALSDNSFHEVHGSGDLAYLQWALDFLDHWNACLAESPDPAPNPWALRALRQGNLGYLGAGDRALLQDAVYLECDTFLTMENKLPRNRDHLLSTLGIRVETPSMVWQRVQPWAHLFL